jgi:vacuolar-type H+-ATPase subunit H
MSKQTAVEWFIEQLQQTRNWQRVINEVNQNTTSVRDVIKQAKAMEKEQIIDAHNNGQRIYADITFLNESEQYYNETFKNK